MDQPTRPTTGGTSVNTDRPCLIQVDRLRSRGTAGSGYTACPGYARHTRGSALALRSLDPDRFRHPQERARTGTCRRGVGQSGYLNAFSRTRRRDVPLGACGHRVAGGEPTVRTRTGARRCQLIFLRPQAGRCTVQAVRAHDCHRPGGRSRGRRARTCRRRRDHADQCRSSVTAHRGRRHYRHKWAICHGGASSWCEYAQSSLSIP